MLNNILLQSVLCLDIETVPQYPTFAHVPEEAQKLWLRKAEFIKPRDGDTDTVLYDRAGIYAEFGKIICISTGVLRKNSAGRTFRMQSFCGDDEEQLLMDFANILHEMDDDTLLCAHNGKEFDFPYLCRRMLINGIKIPPLLQISGKKPWEVSHLDTMELWKFGDHKHYTPLQLLAHCFGIENPKNDIDGSMVYDTYWRGGNLARIKDYCTKDVITVMQVLLRMKGEMLLNESEIIE